MLVERQVITTWHTPEEKLPPEGNFVVVTISGNTRNVTFDHALMVAEWYDGEGWCIDRYDFSLKGANLTVHAWCDLEPYNG